MRQLIRSLAGFAVLAGLSACAPAKPHTPQAVSADRFAKPAAEAAAPVEEVGYDAGARHIADCLAAHSSYDYRTDSFHTYSGQNHRCAPR